MAVSLSGLPGLTAFDTIGEPATLAQRWKKWKGEFELYVAASGVTDPTQKRALLLHLAGTGVRDIFKTFPTSTSGEAKDFDKAMQTLSDHFKPKKNVPMARQTFLGEKPKPGEIINNFITRLQTLAETCEYGEEKDNQVRDQTLLFITDKNLKSKLYREETLTLAKLLNIVSQYHHKEALILVPDNQVNNIYASPNKPGNFRGKCWRCNIAGHKGTDCRVTRDHKCSQCGVIGHFEVCCKSQPRRENQAGSSGRGRGRGGQGRGYRGYSRGPGAVRSVQEDADMQPALSTDEEEYYYAFTAVSNGYNDNLELMIEDNLIDVVIDSGASCNLMSKEVFSHVTGGRVSLSRCDKKVYTYAATEPLQLLGKCSLNVCVPKMKQSVCAEFFIIPTKAAACTLLSRKTSESLGVLRVGVNVNACSAGSSEHSAPDKKAALKDKYPKLFEGLGKLRGYQLKLHIDESVHPVAQPLRRIPFSRRRKVVEKLEQLETLDVIEKVDGPTSWVNPLVVVEKPGGDVRICLDMRQANRAIVREKHPVPTVEETLQEVSGAKVFSKLDLNMAFHQIELHPDSRDITTFAGPNGLYRYKRLLFGVNMATEKFQQILWQIIKDCPGAHNMHDDLRVVGIDEKEHDENLDRVMRKLEQNGITLNYQKCEIAVPSMIYMGDVLSGDGLKVSSERVKAIVEAPRPQNQPEMRSFLGSVQFCSKFIPNFATVSGPLWDLTRKDHHWRWGKQEENAFQKVKKLLTEAPVMAYHKQGADTRLITDASPVGLGAILEQKQGDGLYRPVYYASRKLSNVETRYSQFERETLAVRWACQKFYLFLYGIEFEICTDHKPLLVVLSLRSKPPSLRIERWLLYLQQFCYTVRHIPGKENSADVLSRLPVGETQIDETRRTEEYARSIASEAVPAALTPKEVQRASEEDATLQLVRKALITEDWTQLQGTMYKALKDELWLLGQIVMRGNRIVMPHSLWKHTIMLAHEGHQGMVRTKARLREKVWWPQMQKQVEQVIRACHPCQLVGQRAKPEPIRSTKLPKGPWSDLTADLLEVTGGEHLLVIVDQYTRWPEAILLPNKTDAKAVIKCMQAIFRTHGLPETVRTDNGPPFASKEFEGFLDYLSIEHKKGTPLWPQSNGEVERFNETILKSIRIAKLEATDWRKAVENFLFQFRTTPHTVTGISPAELLMGRKVRDKLPKVKFTNEGTTELECQQLLRERDAKAKLRQKEYADLSRSAKPCDIEEGEEVLLKQDRENKLSPNFEPEPYTVLQRKGNAVVIENTEGKTKMRNIALTKRFIRPEDEEEDVPSSANDEVTGGPADAPPPATPNKQAQHPSSDTPVQQTSQAQGPSSSVSTDLRPARASKPPAWMKDYVCSQRVDMT